MLPAPWVQATPHSSIIWKHNCTNFHHESIFKCSIFKCTSTVENTIWQLNKLDLDGSTWMDLENIRLNEISKLQNIMYNVTYVYIVCIYRYRYKLKHRTLPYIIYLFKA